MRAKWNSGWICRDDGRLLISSETFHQGCLLPAAPVQLQFQGPSNIVWYPAPSLNGDWCELSQPPAPTCNPSPCSRLSRLPSNRIITRRPAEKQPRRRPTSSSGDGARRCFAGGNGISGTPRPFFPPCTSSGTLHPRALLIPSHLTRTIAAVFRQLLYLRNRTSLGYSDDNLDRRFCPPPFSASRFCGRHFSQRQVRPSRHATTHPAPSSTPF